MAINNPYIPGDPYSYDLKWLVARVKEILAQLGTLDEAIEAKIFEGFLEHSIVQFKTVPEMLAADITDGSIVLTLGYHEAGDQGGTFYLVKDFNPAQCALDYFLTLDNNKQIAIPVIVTPYVTPEMFGAYGNGTEDDTEALQLAAKLHDVVVLPAEKSYYISGSIDLKDDQVIQGGGTILDHFTPETGSTTATGILDATDKKHITIDGVHIKGTGAGGLSVLVNYKETLSFNNCEDVTVKNCTIEDINSFAAIRFNGCNKVSAVHNYIERYSYAGISCCQGSDNVLVDGNKVFECLNDESANTYPITLHSYEITPYSGMKHGKNIVCVNNTVYNSIPHWSSIDAHGGIDVVVANNVCDNCAGGIAVFSDPDRFFYAENVIIQGNIIHGATSGTIQTGSFHGITASGKNFLIYGNYLENMGYCTSGRGGGMYLFSLEDSVVKDNVIKNSYCHALNISSLTKELIIEGNVIDGVNKTDFADSGIAVFMANGYYGNVEFKRNRVKGAAPDKRIIFAPNNVQFSDDYVMHIRFEGNEIENMEFADMSRFGNWNLNYSVPQFINTTPAGRQGRKGDIIFNLAAAAGQPLGWICTASFTGNNYATWIALPTL